MSPTQAVLEKQLSVLVSCGVYLLDAEEFLAEALALLPPRTDLLSYTPTPSEAQAAGYITRNDIAAARSDWYASTYVKATMKRVLDAHVR